MAGCESQKRILFIDDEVMNLLGAKSLFRRDFEVYTAVSADEGRRILDSLCVDAVVSDQRMPGKKGTDLFKELSDRERTGLRLILTGYADDEDVQEALRSGIIDAVLDKPLKIQELLQFLGPLPDRDSCAES